MARTAMGKRAPRAPTALGNYVGGRPKGQSELPTKNFRKKWGAALVDNEQSLERAGEGRSGRDKGARQFGMREREEKG